MQQTSILVPRIPSSTEEGSVASNHFVKLLGSKELVFLEIQGSISRLDAQETRLGRLVQQEDGRIYLVVGYQKMEGRVVTLKTPFAVLRRRKRTVDAVETLVEHHHAEIAEMELVDVCRKKIYFGLRPEPMNDMDQVMASS